MNRNLRGGAAALIVLALGAQPSSAQNLFDRLGNAVRDLTGEREQRPADPARTARRQIQRDLNTLGYDAGPADGIFGARTRAAISAFQTDISEPATGELTPAQAERLAEMAAAAGETPGAEPAPEAAERPAPELMPHATPQSLAESRPRETPPRPAFSDCADCPEMVSLPAGSFMMGATEAESRIDLIAGDTAAMPRHEVTIPYRFAIGSTEVTVAQFDAYVQETGATPGGICGIRLIETGPNARKFEGTLHPDNGKAVLGPFYVYITDGSYRRPGLDVTPDQPAVCVSRNEAKAYLDWLSDKTGKPYRLPTEAEWEYAARAGTDTVAFWGNDLDRACAYANFGDRNSGYQAGFVAPCAEEVDAEWTAPVASYAPNPWGLYDMAGNVQEMTEDCWHDSYEGAPADGRPWMEAECQVFVARGGDYELLHISMRASERLFYGKGEEDGIIGTHFDGADFRSNVLGFRAAMSLEADAWDLRGN